LVRTSIGTRIHPSCYAKFRQIILRFNEKGFAQSIYISSPANPLVCPTDIYAAIAARTLERGLSAARTQIFLSELKKNLFFSSIIYGFGEVNCGMYISFHLQFCILIKWLNFFKRVQISLRKLIREQRIVNMNAMFD